MIYRLMIIRLVARSRGTETPHDETTTPKQHCGSGLAGFGAVKMGACCAREVYAACGSRDWAGTSPTSPPRQPHGSRNRARTGAPDGISGGAFWTSAARQTRLYFTF